jgi:hypothetical protein
MMNRSHLRTRLSLVTISLAVIVLSITSKNEYNFALIGITVKGSVLWMLLAVLQVYFTAKGFLTGAINGVIWPWATFNEGSLSGRSASELPEYWEVFFNQAVPIILSAVSFILLAYQINAIYRN